MRLEWRAHAEAQEELRAAAHWYEGRLEGLGEVFVDAVEQAVESVLDPTFSWGYYRGARRSPQIYSRRVAGFPFLVIYVRVEAVVHVLAYAHERRRPGYWMNRLDA